MGIEWDFHGFLLHFDYHFNVFCGSSKINSATASFCFLCHAHSVVPFLVITFVGRLRFDFRVFGEMHKIYIFINMQRQQNK